MPVSYTPLSGNLELSFRLDGKTPFEDVTVLSLPRSYTQTQEDFPTNAAGNDQKPEVKEAFLWKTYCLADPSGYRTSPYFLGLNQGSHTLELTGAKGQIAIASVRLAAYQPPVDYQDYLEEHRQAGAVPASGAEPIVIEAEKLRYKKMCIRDRNRRGPVEKAALFGTSRQHAVLGPAARVGFHGKLCLPFGFFLGSERT